MRKASFLNKLKKEGKLSIIEPSDNMKLAYLNKSASHLASAKILLENKKLEESVSMAYYSMYHSALALFFKVGIKCENHTAASIILKRIFDVDNSALLVAKKERIDKQYYIDFSISEKESKELIRTAEHFNAKLLDFIERLNSEKISKFREKIESLLGIKDK
jgi:uncharacterized protein (UPF0332 family)